MNAGTIRVGIGGWNFEPWRGTFYPEKWPKTRELEYVVDKLTGTEVNATYYGTQKPATFEKWATTASAKDGFQFALKASQYTTVRKVLAEAGESVDRFLDQGLTHLEDRLGPILWQFRDGKRFERDDFARFLELIPDEKDGCKLRHALEVRHESFRDAAFLDLARARNMAVVFADSEDFPCIEEQTADFTYARLQRAVEDCPTGYDDAALDHWASQAKAWAEGGRDVYLFFIAGAKVRNPAAAMALIARL
jgi:uncharacterized protein YecE (DUF72 family)